ncbi:hypothetical protein [Kitasatospora phosalacinea]|uniref:Uncharacterized protein n=1 Tax=Kitasatospora phosalacinea TaxID=2065 RepID=A0A9W6PFF0_9ACTN|nr:hypothetical protein [Kitasatospora phosalacinea]GLW53928.1 hypothetical protein Kpho01_19390 [Kitasatospora phosalacinea]
MTERSTDRTAMLRRGTEELLAERGMMAEPVALAPQLPTGTGTAPDTRSGPHHGDAVFSHGGRRTPETAGPTAGPATHTELPGHRHRGAERHSAH